MVGKLLGSGIVSLVVTSLISMILRLGEGPQVIIVFLIVFGGSVLIILWTTSLQDGTTSGSNPTPVPRTGPKHPPDELAEVLIAQDQEKSTRARDDGPAT